MPEPEPDDNQGLPPGVPPPPPPRPDLKDLREEGPSYRSEPTGKKKRKKKSKERSHPTDAYPPLRSGRGCGWGGCIGGIAVLLLLALVAGIVAVVWLGPGRFTSQGYETVNLGDKDAVLREPPSRATVYLCKGRIEWKVRVTTVPVALIAKEIHVMGDFHDQASFTAVKVTATELARFAKDLEVRALEFTDLGITLKGSMKGRVMKNIP